MGLLLSVLVACVGVIELLTFFHNVNRRATYYSYQSNLDNISDGYIRELKDARKKIYEDLQRLRNETETETKVTEPQKCIPTFRVNNHEDIEIEYNEELTNSRSPSPRKFLVTEKEEQQRPPSPRKFVVTECSPIMKSKSQTCLPEFLLQEEKTLEASETKQKYLLEEQQGTSNCSVSLPRQFIVTEHELNTVVFDNSCSNFDFEVPNRNEEYYRRSPSPYPLLDLPQVPRNSVCNELVDSLGIVDEEQSNSGSSSPNRKSDVFLISKHNSKEFWTTSKMLEVNHESVIGYKDSKVIYQTANVFVADGAEVSSCISINNSSELNILEDKNQLSKIEMELEEALAESSTYDEKYLDNLDGINRSKIQRSSNSRKSFRRKNTNQSSIESSASTSRQQSFNNDSTSELLKNAANELQKVSSEDDSKLTNGNSSKNSNLPTQEREPFWLIFSGEYTKAMNKDWHGQHFCCWQCDESLTGQRYVLRDEHPYCVSCYESVFANACEKCSRTIGIDSKDLSYKDKHWHEACFLCTTCGESLVDKQFGSKGDRIYCGSCYDQQFASRCDGCHEIFRAGTKKMEYKTRQWHEKCFCCCVCKTPIGTQSFIPREQEIYCAKCYEDKFATRCIKCNKVITSGGVTYKNEPWHRECFTCTHCQKSLAGERFTSRDEKPYCADCFGELFAKRCTACNKPITGIGGTKFISFEDRHWHNDCFFCAMCRTSLVGRGFITDQDDIICPDCAKQKLM